MWKDYLEKLPRTKIQNLQNSLFELKECVSRIAADMDDNNEKEADSKRFWLLAETLESAYNKLDDFLP